MLYDLPTGLEHVKAAKRRVEEAKKRIAEDMQAQRDAKLALLRLLAMEREQRTDASMQKVEEALERLALESFAEAAPARPTRLPFDLASRRRAVVGPYVPGAYPREY